MICPVVVDVFVEVEADRLDGLSFQNSLIGTKVDAVQLTVGTEQVRCDHLCKSSVRIQSAKLEKMGFIPGLSQFSHSRDGCECDSLFLAEVLEASFAGTDSEEAAHL